jgi:hypothetical protein
VLLTEKDCIQLFWLAFVFNPLSTELNPICHLLALLGTHHFLNVSRIRVKSLTLRILMIYIYIYIYIYVCVCVCVCDISSIKVKGS